MEGMIYETKVTTKLHLHFKDVDKHYDGDGRLRFCPENISSMLTGSHFLELQVRDYPNEEKYVIFTSFGVKNLKSEVAVLKTKVETSQAMTEVLSVHIKMDKQNIFKNVIF